MNAGRSPSIRDDGRLPGGMSLNGRYLVLDVIRDDGGSTLYVGRTTAFDTEPVMIKEVVPDGFVTPENRVNAQSRFLREVQVLHKLKHPALPTVIDAFSWHGRHYLVMSYFPGETLETMLARRGCAFAEEDVVGWALEILSALGLMHRHDPPVIYRNLKPGNIVIEPSGMLRLLDFGLARFYTQGKRLDTAPIGPIGYAPPEQTSGTTDARSDLYALGVTMHHLLTNQHPERFPPGMLPPATCNAEVSPEVAAIIARAVETDPNRRWASAVDMEMVLRRHIVALSGAVRQRTTVEPPTALCDLAEVRARLVIRAMRATGNRSEVIHHLMRLTWMPWPQLEGALSALPVVVPLVEPYKSSLRVLRGLGVEAHPIWPRRGMHALDPVLEQRLQAEGVVSIVDPAACEDGLCLCRHCHFGWMIEEPSGDLPEACPSCGRYNWNQITLRCCPWCGHQSEGHGKSICTCICTCCGLPAPEQPEPALTTRRTTFAMTGL